MTLTEEQLNQMRQFGQLNYDPRKICILLEIEDVKAFIDEFQNQNSKIKKYYVQGQEIANLTIDKQLLTQAKKGDVDALDRLTERQEKNQYKKSLNQLFGE